jgi:hypothetical protein
MIQAYPGGRPLSSLQGSSHSGLDARGLGTVTMVVVIE